MKNYTYVVTEETSHNIVGVYTDAMLANNAIWYLSRGCTIENMREELIGSRYSVINPETGAVSVYYIEKMELNEKFWR